MGRCTAKALHPAGQEAFCFFIPKGYRNIYPNTRIQHIISDFFSKYENDMSGCFHRKGMVKELER